MSRGDIQTFYPLTPGLGLNESGFYNGNESKFDPCDYSLDDSQDDQENTETLEGEETDPCLGAPIEEAQLPCFREEVRKKKRELKNQFGKGHFSVGECGIKPSRLETPKYNPIIRIPKVGKGNIIPGNEEAYDNATHRWNDDMAIWNACRAQNSGVWVSGWRKEWRKFKKSGGLNALKQISTHCVLGNPLNNNPINTPPPTTPAPNSYLNCNQLRESFGIVPGQSWGSADENIRNLWNAKQCTGSPAPVAQREVGQYVQGMSCAEIKDSFGIIPGKSFGTAPVEAISDWKKQKCTGNEVDTELQGRAPGEDTDQAAKNKKLIIIGIVAVVLIIGIAFLVKYMRAKANVK